MLPELVRVDVFDVRTAVPAGAGVEAGLVVLREIDEPHRLLRIVVGPYEARAIHARWSGAVASRAGTWDLFVSAISMLEGRLNRAVITAVEENRHFFAALELDKGGEPMVLACRPSDAIALALRAWGAEIFVQRHVLEVAGVLADGSRPPPPASFVPGPLSAPPHCREELPAEGQLIQAGWQPAEPAGGPGPYGSAEPTGGSGPNLPAAGPPEAPDSLP